MGIAARMCLAGTHKRHFSASCTSIVSIGPSTQDYDLNIVVVERVLACFTLFLHPRVGSFSHGNCKLLSKVMLYLQGF